MFKTTAISLLILSVAAAHAQTPAAIDQVNATQQRRSLEQASELRYDQDQSAPELYPGETEDIGPQSVLSLKPRKTLFEGLADSQYYFTDNVFLDHTARVHSGVLVSTAQFALAPTPYALGGGQSAPRIGFREQWFDFFEYDGQTPNLGTYDFNAQTAFVDEHWTHGNWILGVGFDYTRLLTTSGYRQFYQEYVPRWEVTRQFPISRTQSFSLGYHGYYHFTDASQFQILPQSSFFDRLDQLLIATYSWEPCANVIVQPYYAFRYTHYTSGISRDDYLNSIGVGVYYFFNKYVSARAFAGYDKRFSNLTAAEYHQLNAGAGLNFTIAF